MARGRSREKIRPRRAWEKEYLPTQEVPEMVSSVG
jgi:hypothetical protein